MGVVSADPGTDPGEHLGGLALSGSRSVLRTPFAAVASAPDSATCRLLEGTSAEVLLICGSPLHRAADSFEYPGSTAFDGLTGAPVTGIRARLGGQYAAIRMRGDRLDLFCDQGGLRSIYVVRRGDVTWFSTHLRLLASAGLDLQLDPRRFGSHWLGHNLLSDRFFVKGLTRLYGSRTARIDAEEPGLVEIDDSQLMSGSAPNPDPIRTVEAFMVGLPEPIFVGLSGGLDSRTVLAAMAGSGVAGSVFTFGENTSADVRVATQLASAAGLPFVRLPDAGLADLAESGLLSEFAADMTCSVPVSAARRLANYGRLDPQAVVLDGGFGEIGRAQLYRCVELARATRYSRKARSARWRRCLAHARADVFAPEVAAEMEAGFLEDIEGIEGIVSGTTMSRPVDELAIRFRRPNFFGLGQAWIDRFCFNAMPFAQEEFVSGVLALPMRRRRGGRYFKRYVRRAAPALAELPLVKGSMTYPFGMPAEVLPPYSRLRRQPPVEHAPVLEGLREYVGDLVASRAVRECALYDRQKIDELVTTYFATGRGETALDWFLSFELWRGGVLGA